MDLLDRLGADAAVYANAVAERVRARLGHELVGVWLFGSGAVGGFSPQTSDLDIQAVSASMLPRERRRDLARELSHEALPCPVRGLEFVLYAREGLGAPDGPEFQLNLNTGERMDEHVALDSDEDPRFWFTIDVAIGREHGVPLIGPPPAEVFPAIAPERVRAALDDLVDWYSREGAPDEAATAVLRARAYAQDGVWLPKRQIRR